MTKISPHFTLAELTTTSTGLVNSPGWLELERLTALCVNVLEPLRAILGVPLRINSGFRSDAVNKAVGGVQYSQHRLGEAADIVPIGMSVWDAMEKIKDAVLRGTLTVDQAIVYHSGFIHVSYFTGKTRGQRKQLLSSPSRKVYEKYR